MSQYSKNNSNCNDLKTSCNFGLSQQKSDLRGANIFKAVYGGSRETLQLYPPPANINTQTGSSRCDKTFLEAFDSFTSQTSISNQLQKDLSALSVTGGNSLNEQTGDYGVDVWSQNRLPSSCSNPSITSSQSIKGALESVSGVFSTISRAQHCKVLDCKPEVESLTLCNNSTAHSKNGSIGTSALSYFQNNSRIPIAPSVAPPSFPVPTSDHSSAAAGQGSRFSSITSLALDSSAAGVPELPLSLVRAEADETWPPSLLSSLDRNAVRSGWNFGREDLAKKDTEPRWALTSTMPSLRGVNSSLSHFSAILSSRLNDTVMSSSNDLWTDKDEHLLFNSFERDRGANRPGEVTNINFPVSTPSARNNEQYRLPTPSAYLEQINRPSNSLDSSILITVPPPAVSLLPSTSGAVAVPPHILPPPPKNTPVLSTHQSSNTAWLDSNTRESRLQPWTGVNPQNDNGEEILSFASQTLFGKDDSSFNNRLTGPNNSNFQKHEALNSNSVFGFAVTNNAVTNNGIISAPYVPKSAYGTTTSRGHISDSSLQVHGEGKRLHCLKVSGLPDVSPSNNMVNVTKQAVSSGLIKSSTSVMDNLHTATKDLNPANVFIDHGGFIGNRSFLLSSKNEPIILNPQIVDVWAHNLEEEFRKIQDVVERYQYVAIDTEFPGVVAMPMGICSEYHYKTIKCNVDLLKVIQLGITFADERGCTPLGTSTWQFNFKFDLDRDMYAENSINFLRESGIDFQTHQNDGIDIQEFGEVIMSSGLVMNKDVKWISFHGSYDFGYLLKLLTCAPLPESESQFFALLHDFFPSLYDIKYLLKNCRGLSSGASLQKIAEHLNVHRIGPQHQAGSDSLVTCQTFFRLMDRYFDNLLDDSIFSGVIYGLGSCTTTSLISPPIIHRRAISNSPPSQQGQHDNTNEDKTMKNDY